MVDTKKDQKLHLTTESVVTRIKDNLETAMYILIPFGIILFVIFRGPIA